jgi:hypothetical protein
LPVRIVAVVGATENMPSGHAVRPGDIVRASNGVTIEIINTDAEGRLVLADCLAHAVAEGAERLVDIATLTGSIITALGNTHAGIFGDDDAWVAQVAAAGTTAAELTWRLPLHPDYAKMMESETADLLNANENRKAGSITAAEFLKRFTGDVPWAHLDIAGMAWGTGKQYAPKGGNGFGVRLFVELALRPRFAAARHASAALFAPLPRTGSAWVLGSRLVGPNGATVHGPLRMPAACGSAVDRAGADRCMADLGYRIVSTFQPGDRYWRFQWTEATIFVSLAAVLVAVGYLVVTRRDA